MSYRGKTHLWIDDLYISNRHSWSHINFIKFYHVSDIYRFKLKHLHVIFLKMHMSCSAAPDSSEILACISASTDWRAVTNHLHLWWSAVPIKPSVMDSVLMWLLNQLYRTQPAVFVRKYIWTLSVEASYTRVGGFLGLTHNFQYNQCDWQGKRGSSANRASLPNLDL